MDKNTDKLEVFDDVLVKENGVKGIIEGAYMEDETPQIIVRIKKSEITDEFYEFKPNLTSGIFLFEENEITKVISKSKRH